MDVYMLTTTDNPYSPVTHYDAWLAWDMQRYNSNSLLARVVRTSSELSDADQIQAIQEAIDEIVRENVSGMHAKIKAGTLSLGVDDVEESEVNTETQAA